ncbi:hypothetical protein L7F22_003622 [Adiantum nelumboides]|nr:hypothetical protein [Adiantum nelumboides]
MVACPDDIFETWCAIIDDVEKCKLEGKRPNPTHFRCLCGLEFEVRSIQDMLKKGKIVLSKGAGEKSKTDMPNYAMWTKQDKKQDKMFFGAIHFMRDAPCCGAIELFSVLIYLSKGERFDGYGSFSSLEGPILDEYLLDIEYKIVRPMDPRAYLQEKKTMLINKCINLYCTEGLMVIDVYSNGFVSHCALKERRRVMGLVESIKEHGELHSKVLSFATSDRQVKEWANIVEDLQTAAQDQQQAIESSTSKTQLILENKTPPSKPFDPRADNCIFPSEFDLDAKDDNILMGELLPYLMQLDDAEDVWNIINSDRYGQLPVLYGHELFNLVSDVIEYWKEPNAEWSQKTLHLGKLLPAKQVQDIIDTKSSSTTSIGTRNTKITTRASQGRDTLQDILRKEGPLVPHMKSLELISLAKRLGCKGANLKSQSAKAFINRFLNEHGLLDINK